MRRAVREVSQQFDRSLPSLHTEIRLRATDGPPSMPTEIGPQSARGSSPSITGDRTTHRPVTISEWPPPLPDVEPRRSRRSFALGAVGLAAVVSFVVVLAWPSGEETTDSPVAAEAKTQTERTAATAPDASAPRPVELSELPEEKPEKPRLATPEAPATLATQPPQQAAPPVATAPLGGETEEVDPLARRR